MDVGDYIGGVIALAVGLLPWIPASRRLVRRLLPEWRGAEHALAAALVATTGVIVVGELLGLVSGFRRWPFAIVSAVVAASVAIAGVSAPAGRQREWLFRLPRERSSQIVLGCVVICVTATTASIVARDAAVLHTGPLDADSIHYHLTQAAQMVHTHSDLHEHHGASSDGTVYYPFDMEMLDAVAMLGPHPDLAVYGINLLFGWLALLACWVVGARWSAGPSALAAGAAVLALPIVSQASTGPGLNDVPTIAFVVAAVGCLAVAGLPRRDRPRGRWLNELSIAGLALGLAAGTKLDALPIAVLIAVAVVVSASGDRGRAALALVAPALLSGGFWYIRDWVIAGSPVPDTNVTVGGHGFHVVPYPEVKPYAFTVAHYLGNGSVIRHWFVPGLRAVWTDLWPLIGVLLAAGVVLAVFTEKSAFRRLLGIAVVIGFVVYLVTPTTALGSPNQPDLFATNTRYALPVLVIAYLLVATASVLRRLPVVTTAFFTVLVVVLLGLEKLPQQMETKIGVAGALVLAAGVALWIVLRDPRSPRILRAAFVFGLVIVGVGSGAALQRSYLHHRYAGDDDLERLFTVVGGFEHQRIGVTGHGLQYGFFGKDFTNSVNYVGVTGPSHAFDLPGTCPSLVTALQRVRDDYVVVEPLAVEHTDRVDTWMTQIPGVHVVFANSAGTVYKMPSAIPASACS